MITFNLNNDTWEVKFVNAYDGALYETNGALLKGKCDYENRTIYISENLANTQLEKTLIHELSHAIIIQMLLGKNKFDDENVCDFMAEYYGLINNLVHIILTRNAK